MIGGRSLVFMCHQIITAFNSIKYLHRPPLDGFSVSPSNHIGIYNFSMLLVCHYLILLSALITVRWFWCVTIKSYFHRRLFDSFGVLPSNHICIDHNLVICINHRSIDLVYNHLIIPAYTTVRWFQCITIKSYLRRSPFDGFYVPPSNHIFINGFGVLPSNHICIVHHSFCFGMTCKLNALPSTICLVFLQSNIESSCCRFSCRYLVVFSMRASTWS